MKTVAFVRWLAGAAAAFAITAASGDARAHGDVDVDRDSSDRRRGASADASSDARTREGSLGGEAQAEGEERFLVRLDLVLGWGRVPFAVQNLPTTGTQAITYTYGDATPSNVQSFIVAGSMKATKHLALGARLPFTFASFSPNGSASRSTTSFGNIEFEAEYVARVGIAGAAELSLVGALGVALPTARGDEIPPDLLGRDASAVDQNAYDRFSLYRAVALARGDEDGALFAPKRLGLVPRVGLVYRRQVLSVEPSLKVENLIDTSSSLDAPYVGAFVPTLRIGYRLRSVVEFVLRGWATVRFAAPSADRRTSVAIEPGVMLQLGPVLPYVGVIVPLTGLPIDNSFFGIRLGVAVRF